MLDSEKEQQNVICLFHSYRKRHNPISLIRFVAFTGLAQHLKTDKSRRILKRKIDALITPEANDLGMERRECPAPKGSISDIEYTERKPAPKTRPEANPVRITIDPSLATWKPTKSIGKRGQTVKEMELAADPNWINFKRERERRRGA